MHRRLSMHKKRWSHQVQPRENAPTNNAKSTCLQVKRQGAKCGSIALACCRPTCKSSTSIVALASSDHHTHLAFTNDITMSQRIQTKMAIKGGHLHRRCIATTRSPEESHHVVMVKPCGHPTLGSQLQTCGQCGPMAKPSGTEPGTQWQQPHDQ